MSSKLPLQQSGSNQNGGKRKDSEREVYDDDQDFNDDVDDESDEMEQPAPVTTSKASKSRK